MHKSRLLITVIAVLVLVAAFFVYYSTLTSYCLIDETAWAETSVRNRITTLRIKLFFQQIRLKHITLDIDELSDSTLIEKTLKSISEPEVLVLDPVISFACNSYAIDVKSILSNTCSVGITSDNSKGYFSCNLVSDEDSAWSSIEPSEEAVVCRNEDDISLYLGTSDFDKSLIVGYRFSKSVPKRMLYGVVEPKIEDAFKIQSQEAVLNYEFRKTRHRIF